MALLLLLLQAPRVPVQQFDVLQLVDGDEAVEARQRLELEGDRNRLRRFEFHSAMHHHGEEKLPVTLDLAVVVAH